MTLRFTVHGSDSTHRYAASAHVSVRRSVRRSLHHPPSVVVRCRSAHHRAPSPAPCTVHLANIGATAGHDRTGLPWPFCSMLSLCAGVVPFPMEVREVPRRTACSRLYTRYRVRVPLPRTSQRTPWMSLLVGLYRTSTAPPRHTKPSRRTLPCTQTPQFHAPRCIIKGEVTSGKVWVWYGMVWNGMLDDGMDRCAQTRADWRGCHCDGPFPLELPIATPSHLW